MAGWTEPDVVRNGAERLERPRNGGGVRGRRRRDPRRRPRRRARHRGAHLGPHIRHNTPGPDGQPDGHGVLQARANLAGASALPRSRSPALVVHGRRDPFFPVGKGEAIAREIPGAQLLVLEEAATAIPGAAAGDVAEAMLALGSSPANVLHGFGIRAAVATPADGRSDDLCAQRGERPLRPPTVQLGSVEPCSETPKRRPSRSLSSPCSPVVTRSAVGCSSASAWRRSSPCRAAPVARTTRKTTTTDQGGGGRSETSSLHRPRVQGGPIAGKRTCPGRTSGRSLRTRASGLGESGPELEHLDRVVEGQRLRGDD